VVATCPTGKRLLGAGAEVSSSNGQVLLDDIRPNGTLTAVTVNAHEDETGNPANWSVTAYAICASPVAGLQRVSEVSGVDSSSSRVVEAPCPAGKQMTGMGGDITSANGQVVLDALFPDATLTASGFAAFEDDTGNAQTWGLTAYAICANSVRRVTAGFNSQSGSALTVGGACPSGNAVSGAGGEITSGLGRVFLGQVSPGAGADGFFARGVEDTMGTSVDWSVRTYGICGTPLPGVERVSTTGAADSPVGKSLGVACPAGKLVVGTGGEIAAFPPFFQAVVLDGIIPLPGLEVARAGGHENGPGTTESWTVTASAVCATPPPGLQRVAVTSPSDSEEIKIVTASCPAGKHLLGTGAEILNAAGDVLLDDVRPDAALKSLTVTAVEGHAGTTFDWRVTAYAICARQ